MCTLKKIVAATALTLASLPAMADIFTYSVTSKFFEPDTDPYHSYFVGTFTFDSVSQTISSLQGKLSESMTGSNNQDYNPSTGINGSDDMTWVSLSYQLSSVYDAALGGYLVTTFLNNATSTFTTGDGWTPGVGMTRNNGANNAYARIFVNATDPTAALTTAQLNKIAYADCTAGGMMGPTCMTGTSAAGYGRVGTMGGYPVSQTVSLLSVVTVPVPEADTSAMLALGLGLLALVHRQKRRSI